MSNHELTARIKELRELQALIEEARAEAEAIKDAIKAHMGDTEELRAGVYKGDEEARNVREIRHSGLQIHARGVIRSVLEADHGTPLSSCMRKARHPSRPKQDNGQ